jgi:HD superfamily phosphodiesterase
MMDLPVIVEEVEKRWLSALQNICKEVFSNIFLPSHDYGHHMRVWNNAKRLLYALHSAGHDFTQNEIEQIIIAIFFHDTGLTVTLDEKHGKASSEICKSSFSKYKLKEPENFKIILQLIELHEDKEYKSDFLANVHPSAIISASDDIDAIGAIGVYRYAEIYLLRGISVMQLPTRVIDNLDKRFDNLQKYYSNLEEYFNEIRLKYWITREFYSDLQKQYEQASIDELSGAYGIIQVFKNEIIQKKLGLYKTALNAALNTTDVYVSEYFSLLATELDKSENEKA